MLKSIRNSLTTTVVAMTPFLLTACGGDDNPDHKNNITVLMAALFFAFTLAADQFVKARSKS